MFLIMLLTDKCVFLGTWSVPDHVVDRRHMCVFLGLWFVPDHVVDRHMCISKNVVCS